VSAGDKQTVLTSVLFVSLFSDSYSPIFTIFVKIFFLLPDDKTF
jgi:hypothetical protein